MAIVALSKVKLQNVQKTRKKKAKSNNTLEQHLTD